MNINYDVVVAGAGHNSLTAAAYLAKAGLKVIVLERNPWIGGGVVTRELTIPGFHHDAHSTGHSYIQANPLILDDELGLKARFGLKYIYPDLTVATVFDDHSTLLVYYDLDKTCQSIAKISSRDAEAYRKYVEKARKIMPLFVAGLYAPPVPFGSFMAVLEQSREGRELIGVMNKSAFDIIDDLFENDKIKINFLKYTSDASVGPDEKGTGLLFTIMVGYIHSHQAGFPVGGSGSLALALRKCIEFHGGEVHVDTHVSRVIVEGGQAVGVATEDGKEYRARRAVIGSFHPHLLDTYVKGIDPDIIADAKATQSSPYSAIVVHFALNEAPIYHGMEDVPHPFLTTCVTSDIETFRREFDEFRYGRLPPHLTMGCTALTQYDPTRAPPGKSTLYMYGFAPYDLADGGPEKWEQIKEIVADGMLADFQKFTKNMGPENILARTVCSPVGIEESSLSFQHGDYGGIGRFLYQFLGRRPTPELSQYAVPGIGRLYLSGPFMHPGGGVIGGGRATAIKILDDLGMDFAR